MPAYVVGFRDSAWDAAADDPTELDPYSDKMEAVLAGYGGRYLRLPQLPMEQLEGDWHPPHGLIMLEFLTMEQARAFGTPTRTHPCGPGAWRAAGFTRCWWLACRTA